MQDEKGLYYHPYPNEPKSRMYVRKNGANIEFRLWHQDHPNVWERHGWLSFEVIKSAAAMYKEYNTSTNPLTLYDLAVASVLIRDSKK